MAQVVSLELKHIVWWKSMTMDLLHLH